MGVEELTGISPAGVSEAAGALVRRTVEGQDGRQCNQYRKGYRHCITSATRERPSRGVMWHTTPIDVARKRLAAALPTASLRGYNP